MFILTKQTNIALALIAAVFFWGSVLGLCSFLHTADIRKCQYGWNHRWCRSLVVPHYVLLFSGTATVIMSPSIVQTWSVRPAAMAGVLGSHLRDLHKPLCEWSGWFYSQTDVMWLEGISIQVPVACVLEVYPDQSTPAISPKSQAAPFPIARPTISLVSTSISVPRQNVPLSGSSGLLLFPPCDLHRSTWHQAEHASDDDWQSIGPRSLQRDGLPCVANLSAFITFSD